MNKSSAGSAHNCVGKLTQRICRHPDDTQGSEDLTRQLSGQYLAGHSCCSGLQPTMRDPANDLLARLTFPCSRQLHRKARAESETNTAHAINAALFLLDCAVSLSKTQLERGFAKVLLNEAPLRMLGEALQPQVTCLRPSVGHVHSRIMHRRHSFQG